MGVRSSRKAFACLAGRKWPLLQAGRHKGHARTCKVKVRWRAHAKSSELREGLNHPAVDLMVLKYAHLGDDDLRHAVDTLSRTRPYGSPLGLRIPLQEMCQRKASMEPFGGQDQRLDSNLPSLEDSRPEGAPFQGMLAASKQPSQPGPEEVLRSTALAQAFFGRLPGVDAACSRTSAGIRILEARGGSPSWFSTARRQAVGGCALKTADAPPPFSSAAQFAFVRSPRRSPLVDRRGLEPRTNGLRVRCSTD